MTDPIAKPAASTDVEDAINRRLFETSIDLILVVDRKGNLIRVSPSARAILGYDAEHMVGHSAAEFLYPEDLESTRSEMRAARRGRIMRNFTCRYVHREGRDADVPEGDYVMIEARDTGTGIAPDAQAHIFEPFFSTKEAGRGSGLGLSMVYGFIKQSGGHVTVHSELGRGTCFRLYLPKDAAAPTAAPTAERAQVRGGSETILVVEDNAKLRAVTTRQLRELGYAVVEAADAEAAFAALERAPIDLLLTDIMMPGKFNGPELARAALARTPHLRVIFASGYPDAPASGDWLTPGAKLLTKPYRRDHLARALREALDYTNPH